MKQLFNKLAGEEHHHHDIINEMLQGQQPNLNHNQQIQQPRVEGTPQGTMNDQHDNILCTELLSTEKYVSGTYDIDVFEFAEPIVRQAMQHLQRDEQRHSQELFNYMNSHGMYNVK